MRCLSRFARILKNKSLMVVPIAAVLAAVYWWQTVLAVLLGMVKLVFGMILYNQPPAGGHRRGPVAVCGQIRWLLAMAQADGQGSVTFSDQVRPTGCFSDSSCSWQMKDESGTREIIGIQDGDPGSTVGMDETRFQRRTGSNTRRSEEGSATKKTSRSMRALSRISLPRPSIFQAHL